MGGTLNNATATFAPTGSVGPSPTGAVMDYVPLKVGSTVATVNFTDSNNAAQVATFTINVTA
jgi:hypothetical protein